MAGLAYMGR